MSLNQNWDPNGKPPNDGTADLIFTGFARLTPEASITWDLDSITFSGNSGAFTLIGSTLTIQAASTTYGISNLTSVEQTLDTALILGSSQTWNAGAGDLTFTGTSIDLGAHALTLTGSHDFSIDSILSGTDSLTKNGSGITTLTGANSYSGGTTVGAGQLIGNSTSLQGSILNNATLTFDQGSNGTYSGIISGTGLFEKSGAGALTLAGNNTYTGETRLTSGVLSLGTTSGGGSGGSFLGDSTLVNVGSGTTFNLNGYAETIGNLTGSGDVTLGSSGNLTLGGDNDSQTFSGNLTGAGSLTKTGTGTFTLSGSGNTYSGGTTVSGGSLRGDATSLQGNIAIGSGATVNFDQGTTGTFAEDLSGGGDFTKTGSGQLTLSGNNTHTGATTLSAGAIVLDSDTALNATTAVSLASGATLSLGTNVSTGVNLGSLDGGGDVALGSKDLTVGANNGSTSLSGQLGGTGTLTKAGSGTFTLAGDNSGFAGDLVVSGGTLAGNTTSLTADITNNAIVEFNQTATGTYSGVISGIGSLTKANGGTVTLTGTNTFTGGTTVSGGTLRLGDDDVLAATGDLTLGATATLALDGYSQQVGTLSYHDSILDFGTTSATNYFLFGSAGTQSGTLSVTNWNSGEGDILGVASAISGSFLDNIYFAGLGAGQLSASQQSVGGYGMFYLITPDTTPFYTWDGGSGSTNDWSDPDNWGGSDIANAPTNKLKVEFAGTTRLGPELDSDYDVNTIRFADGAGAFVIDSASGPGRDITFVGQVPSIIQLSSNDQTIHNDLTLATSIITDVSGSGGSIGDLILNGSLSGSGGITKYGAGTLQLNGASSFDGTVTISAGTVRVSNDDALGSTTGGTEVAAGATLELNGGISITGEALALEGTLTDASGNNTFAGTIGGSGEIDKAGSGSLTLGGTGANTFTGGVIVGDGTLILNKSSGVDAVASNATVTGDGILRLANDHQINDAVEITLGSGVSPTFDLDGNTETIGALNSSNTASVVDLGNGGFLTTGGNNGTDTFDGTLTGNGDFTKTGTGTMELSGNNSHGGATTVADGTLTITHSNALGSTAGATTIDSGATLNLDGSGGNLTVVENITIAGTLTDSAGSNTLSGVLSGGGILEKSGSGTLTISGSSANTFNGTTDLTDGTTVLNKSAGTTALGGTIEIGAATLQLNASEQLANSAVVNLNNTASTFNLNNQSETIGALSGVASSSVSLGSGDLTVGGNNTDTDFAGVISGTGNLTKTGNGELTFRGVNTFTGNTTVGGGTLALGISNALNINTDLTLQSGSTLQLNGAYSLAVTDFSFSDATLDFGTMGSANDFLFSDSATHAATLSILNWSEGADRFGTENGSIGNAFLSKIYFEGIGVGIGAEIGTSFSSGGRTYYELNPIETFVWDGQKDSGGGPTNINWSHGNNWVDDIAPGVSAGKAIIFDGALRTSPNLDAAFVVNSILFADTASAFTLNSSTGETLTVNGGGIYNDGTNLQTLNVTIALGLDQGWTADAGDLAFTGPQILTNGYELTLTGASDLDLSSAIIGTGSLVKEGTGTATLSGTSSYSGTTTVSGGVLAVQSSSALGDSGTGTTVENGGTLQIDGTGLTIADDLSLAGSGSGGQGALRNITGSNSVSGAVSLSTASTIEVASSTGLTLGGILSGSDDLTKTGQGLLLLNNAANTYTGDFQISEGTLRVGVAGAISDSSSVTLADTAGAILDVNSLNVTIAGLNGGGSTGGEVTLGSGTLTVGHLDATASFDGTISGSGNLAKTGAGTFTLGGANTFAGSTTINAGTLTVTSDTALGATSGATTVSDGASLRLDGNGLSIAENLTLAGDGVSGGGALRNTGGTNAITGSITLTDDSRIEVDTGAILNLNGAITDGGGGAGLSKTGEGTLVLAGDNTYTGDTVISGGTLSVSGGGTGDSIAGGTIMIEAGGTLLLDGSDRIGTSVDLVLGGGTLELNGHNLSLNSLTLTADSVIDFGGGDAILDFTGGASGDWSGYTLTITNWAGNRNGGGADQLIFSGGINSSQLGQISFSNPAGFTDGDWGAELTDSNEVVPTPEPSTWLAGVLLLLFGTGRAWFRRRSPANLT